MAKSIPPAQSPTSAAAPLPLSQYNVNTAVITAALICAILCAIGLNSMLRCIFRCTHRTVTRPAEWVAARRLNSGLKKKDMVALPWSIYADSGSPASCAICLGDFDDGEKIRVLPKCFHRFHVGCVDKWLFSHSSCPTCRIHLKSNSSVLEIVTAVV